MASMSVNFEKAKKVRPRTVRKAFLQAPLHVRKKFVSAHLSEELRKKLKRRSMPVRKGDKVKIMRGTYKGKEGKVAKVDLKKVAIYIEGVTRRKIRGGKEVFVPIHPSNVLIIELAERK